MKQIIVLGIMFLFLAQVVLADEDNYFSVFENFGPYEVVPGDDFELGFMLSNRGLLSPKNVTVSVDPCPEGWKCAESIFSYDKSGRYNESLLISVPKEALPKRYTLSIVLESEYWTQKGDNRVVVTVLSEEQARALTYDEYLAKEAERESKVSAPVKPVGNPEQDIRYDKGLIDEDVPVEQVATEPVQETPVEPQNTSSITADVGEAVERLESDRQFVEYISIVLVVILVFIIAGAFTAHILRKERK